MVKMMDIKPAYTQIPKAMLQRYIPLAKASPSHRGPLSGMHGIRSFHTRKGHIHSAATFGKARNSNGNPIGIDNPTNSAPSESEAAAFLRCFICMSLSHPANHRLSVAAWDHTRPDPITSADL